MVDVADVEAKIDELIEVAARMFRDENEARYEEFQSQITDLEGLAREAFQAKLDVLYWPILAKLEEGQPLTAAEYNILELLMVGEAQYYLKAEQDVEQWRRELKRQLEELKKQQVLGLDEIDSLMRVRALCREALRVVPAMAYYCREKERVRDFDDMTRTAIDTETRRSLANRIKEMMESDQL